MLDVFEYNQHFVAMMNIINSARLNPPKEGHKHHIIPKCWFKMMNIPVDNSKDNLVLLSYDNHCKVHKLALLCAKDKAMRSKLGWALKRLTYGTFMGCHHTEESKRKNANAHKGKHHSIESLRKLSEANKGEKNPFYGNHHSEETRRNISESTKGDKNHNYGKHFSDETRKKMSESRKGQRKGMTWKLIDGHRVWYKKEIVKC